MFEIVHLEKGDQIRTEHMFELVYYTNATVIDGPAAKVMVGT